MAATALRARPAPAPRAAPALRGTAAGRARIAALERPLLGAGLFLVSLHLLELALSGPETSALGLAAIVVVPALAVIAQPRLTRPTRFAILVALGLVVAVVGAGAHVLDLFTSGPRRPDLTGVGFAIGGVLLVAAGAAALASRPAPRRVSRRRRAAHVLGWLAGAFVIGQFVVLPVVGALVVTHAFRLPVDGDALGLAHETVRIPTRGGHLAAWYVPSKNGASVLVVHGSGSHRGNVARQAEIVARHGYGVLSIDLPGHGESDGRAHRLGANAQPAVGAALDWLVRQRGVDPGRIAGFGMSLGGEVLLEAASHDARLRAVISDGAERASDDRELGIGSGLARAVGAVTQQVTRGVSGMREPSPLVDAVGRIAPRPVMLVAAGGRPDEIPVNEAYRRAAGPTATLWTLPEAGHTKGVRVRPAEYERRVAAFLARALARPAA